MMESLGMVMKKADLDQMVKDADADGSGEIEFNEFVFSIVKAAATGASSSSGVTISSLFSRQKNSVKMAWRTDRIGDNITVDATTNTVSYATAGKSSVALLSPWLPGDDPKCMHTAPAPARDGAHHTCARSPSTLSLSFGRQATSARASSR